MQTHPGGPVAVGDWEMSWLPDLDDIAATSHVHEDRAAAATRYPVLGRRHSGRRVRGTLWSACPRCPAADPRRSVAAWRLVIAGRGLRPRGAVEAAEIVLLEQVLGRRQARSSTCSGRGADATTTTRVRKDRTHDRKGNGASAGQAVSPDRR
ncbi:hypothetical protein GCM10022262_22370 [Georgenia daeguensis]|uniref:Cytochrome b5 heme-binding domain-containing protein n=1 Tax=Georgenia daeguensis TaxID=908355 RepID=A0ABP8EVD6_9MICO